MLTLAAKDATCHRADLLPITGGHSGKDFPYYGSPYTAEEQVGVTSMPRPAKK